MKKKHNWKRTLFYARRSLIRWTVALGGTLAVLCLAVMLMEDPDSRIILEGAVGFYAALWLVDKIFMRKEKRE